MIPGASMAMGDGNEVSGGDAGPSTATGGNVGGSGSYTAGDFYGRGSQPGKGQNNQLLIIGAAIVVGMLIWTRKK